MVRVDGFGSLRCHAVSGVRLYQNSPHAHYEVPEFGAKVHIEDMAPAPLAELVGHEIVQVTPLTRQAGDAGFVLETTGGSVCSPKSATSCWSVTGQIRTGGPRWAWKPAEACPRRGWRHRRMILLAGTEFRTVRIELTD